MREIRNEEQTMKEQIGRLKCLNSLELKLIAFALMLCDHMWSTVVPGA